jgi:hypothetical protein
MKKLFRGKKVTLYATVFIYGADDAAIDNAVRRVCGLMQPAGVLAWPARPFTRPPGASLAYTVTAQARGHLHPDELDRRVRRQLEALRYSEIPQQSEPGGPVTMARQGGFDFVLEAVPTEGATK